MNKIKIVLIIFIAILGAYLIYDHFDKIRKEEVDIDKFASEYTLVDNDNIFEYKYIDDIIETISNGTGIVFLCTPESAWCQRYALYLNDSLKKYGIEKVSYMNIKAYREINTTKYRKLVELLKEYEYKDDLNNSRIVTPDLTFVKNGIIIAHDNETSLVTSDNVPEEYWNQEKINSFDLKIKSFVDLMNQEMVLEGDE